MKSQYSILIQWSDEDDCYVVSLPEWGDFCHTHGNTYEEALANAQEVLELLIESARDRNQPFPQPNTYDRLPTPPLTPQAARSRVTSA
ncbi:type II toxin-antitoxin system HicB family antitoxin [Synechococcus sp. PCC 7336]|uniref:type II toxin-antitoxin system HicB family antitoxin n=1 Tax=Synechococcus sp. PCC 7336 TaxID=195250 RepID=UPI00034D8367|nr:type II toxin-antitoxin system HicB family antitoxin [Synechococcus sp. PCC 7336]